MLADIIDEFDNHTSSGIVGVTWVFPMLERYGRSDLALAVLRGDTAPAYGRMIQQNMTTLCESWNCTFHETGGRDHACLLAK